MSKDDLESEAKREKKDPHTSALRDFVQQTIADPSFFDLEPEKQKEVAMGYIQKHKKGKSAKPIKQQHKG